ncbi:MAG TPA: hypothetical protein VEI97_18605 [bacterium]|nr:hypothetical protein [bacterium]
MRRAVTGHFDRATIELWDPTTSHWHPVLLAREVQVDRHAGLHHHAGHGEPAMRYEVHGISEEIAHRGPLDVLFKDLEEICPDHHVRLLIRSRAGELHGSGPSYDLYCVALNHATFAEGIPFVLKPEHNDNPRRGPSGVGRFYSHYPDDATAINL